LLPNACTRFSIGWPVNLPWSVSNAKTFVSCFACSRRLRKLARLRQLSKSNQSTRPTISEGIDIEIKIYPPSSALARRAILNTQRLGRTLVRDGRCSCEFGAVRRLISHAKHECRDDASGPRRRIVRPAWQGGATASDQTDRCPIAKW